MALRALFQDEEKSKAENQCSAVPHPYSEILFPVTNSQLANPDQYIYLPLNGISFFDLYNWEEYPPENPANPTPPGRTPPKRDPRAFGTAVKLNEENIALFRHGTKVFGTSVRCPHAGGPLHMGDIEDLPGRDLCVRCPWHGWKFSVTSGQCVGKPNVSVQTYPVKVDFSTGKMAVGFQSLNPAYFRDSAF